MSRGAQVCTWTPLYIDGLFETYYFCIQIKD